MNILVIGTGYVGLVTGTCLSEMGNHVTCLDIDEEKIALLEQGEIPFYEPGLKDMVLFNKKAGRLTFTTSYEKGLKGTDICFIAVGTPEDETGAPNLSYLHMAALQVAAHMEKDVILVNKSTAPVGTAKNIGALVGQALKERGKALKVQVCSNPEFLKEGNAISDFMKPDRILIGADDPDVLGPMYELYKPFTLNHERILTMDTLSAEMSKYAANAMLACRISFMNEMATLCEASGADITKVRQGIGSDKRIGYDFLYAGAGWGGSCFPKDIAALRFAAKKKKIPSSLLDAVEAVNERQKNLLAEKIEAYFEEKGGLQGKTCAILGLAFKPGTDDMREAPSLTLIQSLMERGCQVNLFDPVAQNNARELLGSPHGTYWSADPYEAATGAHALILMTEWKSFRFLDFEKLKTLMACPAFFDGRNQYDPAEVASKGFDYTSIGRPAANALSTQGAIL